MTTNEFFTITNLVRDLENDLLGSDEARSLAIRVLRYLLDDDKFRKSLKDKEKESK